MPPRSRTRLVCGEVPFDPLVPNLAALLRELIMMKSEDLDRRAAVFWASWTLPLVCREARQLSQIDGLQWLRLFERHVSLPNIRAPPKHNLRLCDELPNWFDVHAQVRLVEAHLHVRDVHDDFENDATNPRFCIARMCATGKALPTTTAPAPSVQEIKLRQLIGDPNDYGAPDLDGLVPEAVAQFVGFLRWWTACTLTEHQKESTFTAWCCAPGCARPASVRSPKSQDEHDALFAPSYWTIQRTGFQKLNDDSQWPSLMHWCSSACENAATVEFFNRVHVCSGAELAAAPRPSRSAKVSAARLLSSAIERNAVVARRIRTEAKTNRPLGHYPMSPDELRAYHGKLVDALNVDVGILYSAALLSSWPLGRRPARTLPSTIDWRNNVFPYFRAIYNVRSVYVRVMANRGSVAPRLALDLHTNANTPPRWILSLKDQLTDIF